MINQMKKIDGVIAVVIFSEGQNPEPMAIHGELPLDEAKRLARFANDYMRMLQGLVDQFVKFTTSRQWNPVDGWAVHGPTYSAYGWGNLVCVVDNSKVNHNIIKEVKEAFVNT
jgi:roadblock/LC7 domain-containing protein